MNIVKQSEDDGAIDLKPPDATWIRNQTNWKYLGQQILCQLLPTLCVNIGAFSTGLSLGFPAILLPQLSQEESSLFRNTSDTLDQRSQHAFNLREDHTFIIVQMYGIGAVVGTLGATALAQLVGRRAALMLLTLPDILAWIIAALANTILMIETSRFLAGLAAGGYILCIQVYVGEIASIHNRGWLLALSTPITALGVLSMYGQSLRVLLSVISG